MTDDNKNLYGEELQVPYSKKLPGSLLGAAQNCTIYFHGDKLPTLGTFQAFEGSPYGEFISSKGTILTVHRDELDFTGDNQ